MSTKLLGVYSLAIVLCAQSLWGNEQDFGSVSSSFLQANCYDCHSGSVTEGGLDLEKLSHDLADRHTTYTWTRIHDRVRDGEMPPADYAELERSEIVPFINRTSAWMKAHQREEYATLGRVHARRLTNLQLERTLHDLLGIDIPLARLMPEEPKTEGFNTVAEGQSMSHFQLERHLSVVDAALDEAFRRALSAPDEWTRKLEPKDIVRQNPKRRCREPEMLRGKAVVWTGGVTYYGRIPATTARRDGWYRFEVTASGLNVPEDRGVWCSVRTGRCVSSAPLLQWVTAFEVTEKPQTWTFDAWLPDGHMLEIRPGDITLKQGRFAGGQIGTGEGEPQNVPGLAIHSIVIHRVHQGPDDDQIRERLFGDLKTEVIRKAKSRREQDVYGLVSKQPRQDAKRLMTAFIETAFRRPVGADDAAPYIGLVEQQLDEGHSLIDALRAGYRAVLCSPRFLYLEEEAGRLDDYAIASRLSYFLWSSMPDAELLKLAQAGRLSDREVIKGEVERMLDGERGERFVHDFAAQWLDLDQIDFTQPDRRMYGGFDLIVQESMVDETEAYLFEMLSSNRSISALVDSDHAFLNSRLARYYGIDGVDGDALSKVSVAKSGRRGGLITQGSVLKVTANGTNTSPVLRGVWLCERILGEYIPPPPANVPAIEPDIRGTTTIREMLEKHRGSDDCSSCHRKIDPVGFALENFDPSGRWRDHYLVREGRRVKRGPEIEVSYTLPDGREFEDLNEFKSLVLTDKQKIAKNVAAKLITYGTGGPITFLDRDDLAELVARTEDDDYGFRSLIREVATSRTFLHK